MLFGGESCLKRIKLLSPTLVIQKGALVRNEHTSREVLEDGRVRRGSFTASQPYIPSPVSLEPLLYTCRNTCRLGKRLVLITTDDRFTSVTLIGRSQRKANDRRYHRQHVFYLDSSQSYDTYYSTLSKMIRLPYRFLMQTWTLGVVL